MRPIDADALENDIRKVLRNRHSKRAILALYMMLDIIRGRDTIKVVSPVIHSKWISLNNSSHKYCESCGVRFNILFYERNDYRFCPYCGAKMDGGERSD